MVENTIDNCVLVSAIIITHNRSELCLKAVNSVINQTYNNIEIIVVDDASDDSHVLALEEGVSSLNIKYIHINKSDSRGGNHARNIGVANSKGEYVAFLDDDDEWFPLKIEKQVLFLNEHPDYSFVACGKKYYFDMEQIYTEDDVTGLVEGEVSDIILYKMLYTTSTIMLKKRVFENIGGFDERLKYWQEYELEIRLSGVTSFGVIRENLVLYRVASLDKKRLTNNIQGWNKSVRYINRKHRKLIKSKSEYVRRERCRMIAKDGIERAERVGTSKRKFLLMLAFLEPSFHGIVKGFLGVYRYSDLKIYGFWGGKGRNNN